MVSASVDDMFAFENDAPPINSKRSYRKCTETCTPKHPRSSSNESNVKLDQIVNTRYESIDHREQNESHSSSPGKTENNDGCYEDDTEKEQYSIHQNSISNLTTSISLSSKNGRSRRKKKGKHRRQSHCCTVSSKTIITEISKASKKNNNNNNNRNKNKNNNNHNNNDNHDEDGGGGGDGGGDDDDDDDDDGNKKVVSVTDNAHLNAKVNPIFVWVQQDDTKIVRVLCEDYDRRNRIRLTKTATGWRSIPLTERLEKCWLKKEDLEPVTMAKLPPINKKLVNVPTSLSDNCEKVNNLSSLNITQENISETRTAKCMYSSNDENKQKLGLVTTLFKNANDDPFGIDESEQEDMRSIFDGVQTDSLYSDDRLRPSSVTYAQCSEPELDFHLCDCSLQTTNAAMSLLQDDKICDHPQEQKQNVLKNNTEKFPIDFKDGEQHQMFLRTANCEKNNAAIAQRESNQLPLVNFNNEQSKKDQQNSFSVSSLSNRPSSSDLQLNSRLSVSPTANANQTDEFQNTVHENNLSTISENNSRCDGSTSVSSLVLPTNIYDDKRKDCVVGENIKNQKGECNNLIKSIPLSTYSDRFNAFDEYKSCASSLDVNHYLYSSQKNEIFPCNRKTEGMDYVDKHAVATSDDSTIIVNGACESKFTNNNNVVNVDNCKIKHDIDGFDIGNLSLKHKALISEDLTESFISTTHVLGDELTHKKKLNKTFNKKITHSFENVDLYHDLKQQLQLYDENNETNTYKNRKRSPTTGDDNSRSEVVGDDDRPKVQNVFCSAKNLEDVSPDGIQESSQFKEIKPAPVENIQEIQEFSAPVKMEKFDNELKSGEKCDPSIYCPVLHPTNPGMLSTPFELLTTATTTLTTAATTKPITTMTMNRQNQIKRIGNVNDSKNELISVPDSAQQHPIIPQNLHEITENVLYNKQTTFCTDEYCAVQQEPLDLGMCRSKIEFEKAVKVTLCTPPLLHSSSQNRKRIGAVSSSEKLGEKRIKKSRLIDLLTTKNGHIVEEHDTLLDPLEQLKNVLSNPMYSVPDPLLVPKTRLSALVTCPGKEIPRLLAGRTQNASYFNILSDPNMLAVSLSHLPNLMKKPINEENMLKYQKQTDEIRSRLRQDCFSNTCESMALASYWNQCYWLPNIQSADIISYDEMSADLLSVLNCGFTSATESCCRNRNVAELHNINNIDDHLQYQKEISFWQDLPVPPPNHTEIAPHHSELPSSMFYDHFNNNQITSNCNLSKDFCNMMWNKETLCSNYECYQPPHMTSLAAAQANVIRNEITPINQCYPCDKQIKKCSHSLLPEIPFIDNHLANITKFPVNESSSHLTEMYLPFRSVAVDSKTNEQQCFEPFNYARQLLEQQQEQQIRHHHQHQQLPQRQQHEDQQLSQQLQNSFKTSEALQEHFVGMCCNKQDFVEDTLLSSLRTENSENGIAKNVSSASLVTKTQNKSNTVYPPEAKIKVRQHLIDPNQKLTLLNTDPYLFPHGSTNVMYPIRDHVNAGNLWHPLFNTGTQKNYKKCQVEWTKRATTSID